MINFITLSKSTKRRIVTERVKNNFKSNTDSKEKFREKDKYCANKIQILPMLNSSWDKVHTEANSRSRFSLIHQGSLLDNSDKLQPEYSKVETGQELNSSFERNITEIGDRGNIIAHEVDLMPHNPSDYNPKYSDQDSIYEPEPLSHKLKLHQRKNHRNSENILWKNSVKSEKYILSRNISKNPSPQPENKKLLK